MTEAIDTVLMMTVAVVAGAIIIIYLDQRLTEAKELLREVHENNLGGMLYSGPVRRKVAKFVGSQDECYHGDGEIAKRTARILGGA